MNSNREVQEEKEWQPMASGENMENNYIVLKEISF